MKYTINTKKFLKNNLIRGGAVMALAFVVFFGAQNANAMITRQLDFGSTGSDVTELQAYLSTVPSIYPSGLVTGYFGSLTQAGVKGFQVLQGIVSSGSPATTGYGRVGPTTMARLNAVMGGVVSQVGWDTVPILYNANVSKTGTSATFTWTTNEPTQGQVYWDNSPIRSDEATGPRQQPYVSGALALDAGGLQTNHSVTVSNLNRDTTYYFLVRSVDSVGNMSMLLPTSFHTNN